MIDLEKFQVTIFNGTRAHEATAGKTELLQLETIFKSTWSPIVFNEGARLQNNFLLCQLLVADFDRNATFETVRNEVRNHGYSFIMATSKSHQKPKKNNPACDRFRLILFLENPIDLTQYRMAHQQLLVKFPWLDTQAQSPAQFFFPCTEEIYEREFTGKFFDFNPSLGLYSDSTRKFLSNPPDSVINDSRFKAAKDLQEQGYSVEEIIRSMKIRSSLFDKNSERTIRNAFKNLPKYEKRIQDSNDDSDILNGFYEFVPNKSGGSWKPNTEKASQYFSDKLKIITTLEGCWIWSNTHWRLFSKESIMHEIYSVMKNGPNNCCHSSHVDEVFKKIIMMTFHSETLPRENTFKKANFLNGTLNLITDKFEDHDPNDFFKFVLPCNYEPTADCVKWDKFLEEIFSDDKSKILSIMQMIGYSIVTDIPWLQRCFFLYGDGANGKSVLLSVLRKILGDDNTRALSLDQLDKQDMACVLTDAIANLSTESDLGLNKSANWKAIIAGDPIQVRPPYGKAYMMRTNARLWFAVNSLPRLLEEGSSISRRVYIIRFNKTIEAKNQDPFLVNKLLDEIPGIIASAIAQYKLLLAVGDLPKTTDGDNFKAVMRRENDSVYAFCEDQIKFTANVHDSEDISRVYNLYKTYCDDFGRKYVAVEHFGRRLTMWIKEKADDPNLENEFITYRQRFNNRLTRRYRLISVAE